MSAPVQQLFLMNNIPGAPPALWDPSQLGSDVWAWWKMDAMPEADTAAVSTVADASGNGRVLTTFGSPTVHANAQNNLKSLNFSVGVAYATFASSAGMTAGSFFCVNKGSVGPGQAAGSICDMGMAGSQVSLYTWSDGNVYSNFLSNGRQNAGGPVIVNVWHQMMFWAAANDWGHAHDGTDVQVYITTVTGRTTCYLASDSDTSWRHQGEFGEVVILQNKPTTLNRQKVEGYLAWKWGIQGSLPSGHPYKSAAP